MHETLALPGRERTKHENISLCVLFRHRASSPDRALATECQDGLEIGVRPHQIERGLA